MLEIVSSFFLKPMIHRILILVISILASSGLSAQSASGMELQINRDYYQLKDPGGRLLGSSKINPAFGYSYRYLFKSGLTLNTGWHLKFYSSSKHFAINMGNFSSIPLVSLRMPLLLGWNFALLKDKFYISPLIGINVNSFLGKQESQMQAGISTTTDTLNFRSDDYVNKVLFFTTSLGLVLEYKTASFFSMSLLFQYTKGFSTVSTQEINYQINRSPEYHASQINRGDYLTYLGIRFLFFKPVKTH